ncbi:cisplatin damage response ATP-dependent DNA ligase [Segnochrobactrum spirostomi]|uniref:DNA ligase (ATP) n=1 Tax=Segnochrobactrum spirostomi TaxID=2608987 RepID=A0A6A7Y2E5_9HYPH|nr:cisplatin damage response ATP-dependent DNA ligase [Segnochrobactrum spirostomi]MQT13230.1 cisplatin damage response ATP-dependent DNA ligase [Segnochrobactrum spirostomi]
MNRFAHLLDSLAFEPRRNGKLKLIEAYFRDAPDPDRGFALAALTDTLRFPHAKPGLIRALIAERTDPVLFALSYDFVGDLSETVALLWPTRGAVAAGEGPSLAAVVAGLETTGKADLPAFLAGVLDGLDETGRWAFLKLITGALRVGVSARLAKTALARLGDLDPDAVEEVWHGLSPPFLDVFAWVEGRGPRPEAADAAPFRPPMLAHALDEADFGALDPADFRAEWKWDGIRVQAVAGTTHGRRAARLFSRSGEDLSAAFPDVLDALDFEAAVDGELLIVRDGRVEPFSVLQQRLNRKTVTAKMLRDFPPRIRAYDLLALGGDDLRAEPFEERRRRLEAFVAGLGDHAMIDLSPMVPFADWPSLAAARANPASAGAGHDAAAVEGIMLKRAASPYVPGRPKGLWFKWKRDPFNVDAVLMYAQRGHGRRSSFYSDFTFGVWKAGELVPVGKAYFGFTDEELVELDRFVRRHTINRFGPVREVAHTREEGLVLEVAFEGLNRSTRHKAGLAMRFPRIARIRWDKTPADADEIAVLERMLAR